MCENYFVWRITSGSFIPIVLDCPLPSGINPANARIEFVYATNDPGTIAQMTLAASTWFGTNAWQQNTLPGRIRVWTKDANQNRNPASITNGGDFVTANASLPFTSILAGGATQAVFYLEGVGTSSGWGTDKIHVKVYPIPEYNLLAGDEVSYSVVRCVYKVCVYRPYVCLRDSSNTITNRQVFSTDYSSPSNMITSYFYGQAHFDDYANSYFHRLAAFMGHAFARIEVRTPEFSAGTNMWTGQTGLDDKDNTTAAYQAMKGGTSWWFRAVDGKQDDPAKCQTRYDTLYENPVAGAVIQNTNGSSCKMVAVREFRVRPESGKALLDYVAGHPFSGYGLDTTLRSNANSRVGCATYVTLLTEFAGITNVSPWVFDKPMPIVPLPDIWITYLGSGYNYLQYKAGNSVPFLGEFQTFQANAATDIPLAAGAAAWYSGGTTNQLRFTDPVFLMQTIDQDNQNTTWSHDRGITIRYDVPPRADLNEWRNRYP